MAIAKVLLMSWGLRFFPWYSAEKVSLDYRTI